ncbi:MAG: ABC transporter ATP-binding protein, partial [Dehalococcoidia bacterium]|nr:ABC transporter ATP-binding protein [Dehalococcoidia bacterium]
GDIYIDGLPVCDVKPGHRGVQMVFQSYALWPNMKVLDKNRFTNMSFPLKVRKWRPQDIQNKIMEVARKVGIGSELFERWPVQLSEGQKQKVAVGRAITSNPRVMLMDEPLSHLDPQTRLQVRDEIRRLHDEMKWTTVVVTHNLADAFALADRVAVMMEGSLIQVGTPEEVYKHPVSEVVQDFIRCYDLAPRFRT